MPVSSVQFGQYPWSYVSGLGIRNSSTSPDTQINVAVGSALDVTGVYQLTLSSEATVDISINGLNGLDTGTVAASTVYAVYLVGDPVTQQATGCILSLGYTTTYPLLPFGYSAYSLIGFVTTDADSDILLGSWTGFADEMRLFMYDTPQATSITAGAATTYTNVSLAAFVPKFNADNIFGAAVFAQPIIINSSFTPNSAANTLKMKSAAGVGDAVVITGQVSAVPVTTQSTVLATSASNVPTISYKVSNASDAAAINVAGYWFFI